MLRHQGAKDGSAADPAARAADASYLEIRASERCCDGISHGYTCTRGSHTHDFGHLQRHPLAHFKVGSICSMRCWEGGSSAEHISSAYSHQIIMVNATTIWWGVRTQLPPPLPAKTLDGFALAGSNLQQQGFQFLPSHGC